MDKSAGKIGKIKQNSAAWGVDIVEAFAFDGTKIVDETAGMPSTVCNNGTCILMHNKWSLSNSLEDAYIHRKLLSYNIDDTTFYFLVSEITSFSIISSRSL